MSGPQIPVRSSSKRSPTLEDERDEVNDDLKHHRKRLKPQSSFSTEFWNTAATVAELQQKKNQIQRKISLRDFITEGGTEKEWLETPAAQKLFQELRAQQADEEICKRQSKRLEDDGKSQSTPKWSFRRSFLQLYTTSEMGLGITSTGAGKRNSSTQSNFRKDLIAAYNSQNLDDSSMKHYLWCPILSKWVHEKTTTAAHIFAYMHGQEVMDAIFGTTDPPELFSPYNGLIVSNAVEDVFDDGLFVIVPKLPDNATTAERALWDVSDPKEYQIRIVDFKHPEIDQLVDPESKMTWRALDGKKLDFRGGFRPRARYLYFHHCLQILRIAWKEQSKGEILKKEIGKRYWGSPGRYLPRNMLIVFVEEIGHEYDCLLEGAADETKEEGEAEILLAAASSQIKASVSTLGEIDDEDEEDGEEKGEEGEDRVMPEE